MGLILALLTGLAWGGIGVALGIASKRKYGALVFIAVTTAISAIAAWCFLPDWHTLINGKVDRPIPLIMVLSIAGVSGSLGMFALQRAMSGGSSAWTVAQSAMVIPFLTGIIFLGEPFRFFGGLGLAAIVISLLAFAKGNKEADHRRGDPGGGPWLPYALIAFCFLGAQQALSSLPSSWMGWTDTAGLRVPITLTAGALPLLIAAFLKRRRFQRKVLGLAVSYAILVVTGQYLLFAAMDTLRREDRLSLAFPIALGTCIVLVALWDIIAWKSRPTPLTLTGLLLGGTGVVLLAL